MRPISSDIQAGGFRDPKVRGLPYRFPPLFLRGFPRRVHIESFLSLRCYPVGDVGFRVMCDVY